MTQPISAPPVDLDDYTQGSDPRDTPDSSFVPEKVSATVHVPQNRQVMVFASRFNYSHYYKVPAQVGIQNVPNMVSEMMREGCKLTDIQITFEEIEDR